MHNKHIHIYTSVDLFQSSSMLAYICNPPMPCSPADSNQPLQQYLDIHHCNLPLSSYGGATQMPQGPTEHHRLATFCPRITSSPSGVNDEQSKTMKTAFICIRVHPYGARRSHLYQKRMFRHVSCCESIQHMEITKVTFLQMDYMYNFGANPRAHRKS